jgi:H2C2 zinc finger
VGRVKGCGQLKSHPDTLIDAIIYGRDLGPEGEDFVSEERFDKIHFYLKHNKYPNGADRAEKSRLRSAATHYHLVPEGDKLMLKDKEVVRDPQRQYEIARTIHQQHHGGINKTTATIAEKYHWVRIKETVSMVIRNCGDCKEMAKAPVVRADGGQNVPLRDKKVNGSGGQGGVSAAGRVLSLPHTHPASNGNGNNGSEENQASQHSLQSTDHMLGLEHTRPQATSSISHHQQIDQQPQHIEPRHQPQDIMVADMGVGTANNMANMDINAMDYSDIGPVEAHMMDDVQAQFQEPQSQFQQSQSDFQQPQHQQFPTQHFSHQPQMVHHDHTQNGHHNQDHTDYQALLAGATHHGHPHMGVSNIDPSLQGHLQQQMVDGDELDSVRTGSALEAQAKAAMQASQGLGNNIGTDEQRELEMKDRLMASMRFPDGGDYGHN